MSDGWLPESPRGTRWRCCAAATVLLALLMGAGCRETPPAAPARGPAAPAEPQGDLPRSLLEACAPIAAPLEGKKAGPPVEPLSDAQMAATRHTDGDPALVRLRALETVDEIRIRLRNDPENAALHMQLAEIYGAVLANREARVQHLCRALMSAPHDLAIKETLLAEWMKPGAELDLEVALRPGDRTLPWRAALDAARLRDDLGDERARARHYEHAMRAQRNVRNGALLRRERVRARVDAAVFVDWAARQRGPLLLIASVPMKGLPKLQAQLLEAGRGAVDVTPGFKGRLLAFGQDAGSLLDSLVQAVPGRRVFLVARAGDAQLVASAEVAAGARGPLVLRAFGASPDDADLRALLVAGGLPAVP